MTVILAACVSSEKSSTWHNSLSVDESNKYLNKNLGMTYEYHSQRTNNPLHLKNQDIWA